MFQKNAVTRVALPKLIEMIIIAPLFSILYEDKQETLPNNLGISL